MQTNATIKTVIILTSYPSTLYLSSLAIWELTGKSGDLCLQAGLVYTQVRKDPT